jgi:hypothetical protein
MVDPSGAGVGRGLDVGGRGVLGRSGGCRVAFRRSDWGLYDAIGYGGLGLALGLPAFLGMEGEDFGPHPVALVIVGVTTLGGVLGGAALGSRARRRVAEGREVSRAHRAAALGGVVLAGGMAGALATVPLIMGEGEGTPFGSDEQTITLFVLSGVALGSVFAWKNRGELQGRPLTAYPMASAARGPGLGMRLTF